MKCENTTKKFKYWSNGMTLVEVMMALAIASIGLVAFMSMNKNQQKATQELIEKMAVLDFQSQLRTALMDGTVCSYEVTVSPLTFDASKIGTATPPTLDLQRIHLRPNSNSPIVAEFGSAISTNARNINVKSIKINNIAGVKSGTIFSAKLQIDFNSSSGNLLKPVVFSIILATTPPNADIKSITGCSGNESSTNRILYYFGGMYTETLFNNPVTSSKSCPVGYLDIKINGTFNKDWPLHFCIRSVQDNNIPPFPTVFADFGGIVGSISGGAYNVSNPKTSNANCPSGFTKTMIYHYSNVDWPLDLCWKQTTDPKGTSIMDFGGMYGYIEGSAVINPLSGYFGCPYGFTSIKILDHSTVDWPLYYCYRILD
ncbi:MAG: type II secretion system protein [Oligoflexia bacterium]|nr:type II secretion system protein [Oligoflexia bacterium]